MVTKKKEPDPSLFSPSNPAEGLIRPEGWIAIAEHLNITPKELMIAVLLFEGKDRAAIARRMNRSPSTIRQHIDRLHKKLKVKDRVGFVLRLVRVHQMISTR